MNGLARSMLGTVIRLSSLAMLSGKPDDLDACLNSSRNTFVEAYLRVKLSPFWVCYALRLVVDEMTDCRLMFCLLFLLGG